MNSGVFDWGAVGSATAPKMAVPVGLSSAGAAPPVPAAAAGIGGTGGAAGGVLTSGATAMEVTLTVRRLVVRKALAEAVLESCPLSELCAIDAPASSSPAITKRRRTLAEVTVSVTEDVGTPAVEATLPVSLALTSFV